MKKRLIFILAPVLLVMVTAVTLFAVKIGAATATYDLWVAGTQVTDSTLSGEGWTYEPETNTLVLNGFNYGSGGYGYRLGYDAEARADIYAFIYVRDNNKKGMDLNIRLEGDTSNIGDPYLSGHDKEDAGDGDYETYYGIYNPYGTVKITGTAKLNIYTNQLGILARYLHIEGCTGGISMGAYNSCVRADHIYVRGGSKLNAYCGHSGWASMYNAAICASGSLNIYDTSEVSGEVERDENTDNTGVCGIRCDGNLNVNGGKLTGISWAQGKEPDTSGPACMGIWAKVLNVSGSGVVEAYIRQGVDQKSYLRSTGIGYYYTGNGTIRIKGGAIVRVGVQKKKPDGTQVLMPEDFSVADSLYGICTATSKDGYEAYMEYSAYEPEGIFLREVNGEKQWSYYRDFKKTEIYPTGGIVAGNIVSKNSGLKICVLSGDHTLDPYVEGGILPGIVVTGGTLTLKTSADRLPSLVAEGGRLILSLSDGKTHAMAGAVTVMRGAEIVIGGDGILTGLDAYGNGRILFTGGTVSGTVDDAVTMVVDGGNICVKHKEVSGFGYAVNSKGESLTRNTYTISSDKGVTYIRVDLVTLWSGEYGSTGMYLTDGSTFCMWTPFKTRDEVRSVRASDAGGKGYTLKPGVTDPHTFSESSGVRAHWRSVYVAKPGGSVSFYPFFSIYTIARNFRLIWAYSDDGLSWTTIENPDMDGYGVYTRNNITLEECNRRFRCEIRDPDTDELLDTFMTTLYVLNFRIVADGNCADEETTTFRMVEDVPHPADKTRVRYSWYLSTDGGETFQKVSDNSLPYSRYITEEADGWILRCQAKAWMQAQTFDDYVTVDFPIRVTNRKPKIDRQPDLSPVLDMKTGNLYAYDSSILFSVDARYATSYRWQVAKRTAENPDAPFEDLPKNASYAWQYKFSAGWHTYDPAMQNYVYRCIVSNEYGETITEEFRVTVRHKPFITRQPDNVSVGSDGTGTFTVPILPGNPAVPYEVYWVFWDAEQKTYVRLSEYAGYSDMFTESFTYTTAADGTEYCSGSTLTVRNPTADMNGLILCCYISYEDGNCRSYDRRLIVLTDCQAYGHDWSEATCTAPATCRREGCGATTGDLLPHEGGKATCIHPAVCDVCGNEYGNLDPTTHPDDATDVWNEEDWDDDAGHHSTWSCCGKPKYPYEYHKWEQGVCTVCGCVCAHSLNTPANCHEKARCHTCGLIYGEINPDNHDLSLGTTVSGDKEPACTEEGYTGDVLCWQCLKTVVPGTVIPARGHDDIRAATCQYPAKCTVCGFHGDTDPDNHEYSWSAYYKNATETTHEQHWNCCDKASVLPHDPDENGVCRFCHYGCDHSGGEATCMHQALCEKCGESYGALAPDRHEFLYYPREDGMHVKKCGCNFDLEYSDPEAHVWDKGVCTVCEVSHMDHTESDYWITEAPLLGKKGKRYTECTICHAELGFSLIDAIGFDTVKVGHNCSFGNDLSMLYAILRSVLNGCTDVRLVVEKASYEGNVLAGTVTKTLYPVECTINGKVYYRFDYNGVSAKEMGDTLTATLVFTRDGEEYSGVVDTYSLKAYAMERLVASENTLFRTLLVDLLNYGTAAQTYFGYRTDAPVNGDLTEEQRAFARQDYGDLNVTDITGDDTACPASVTGKNLLFDSRIKWLIATDLGRDSDLTGVSLRIRYTDYTGHPVERLIRGEEFIYRTDIRGYTVCFDGLMASELRTELELTLVRDGAEISATVTYGFDTYVSRRLAETEDEDFRQLLQKTLLYSDSAKEYFSVAN